MRNFNLTNLAPAEQAERELRGDNVTPGQRLVKVAFPRWSDGEPRFYTYIVVRATKTRLIVRSANSEDAPEIRLILQTKSWDAKRDGRVTGRVEGTSEYADTWSLATEDDDCMEDFKRRAHRALVKRRATQAAEAFAKTPSIDTANAAIQAMSLWTVTESVQP